MQRLPSPLQAERAKQQEEEEALTECVFRPEISNMARALKAVEGEVGGGAAWQRLYQRRQMAAKHKVRGGPSKGIPNCLHWDSAGWVPGWLREAQCTGGCRPQPLPCP